jgi:hypothetical protein
MPSALRLIDRGTVLDADRGPVNQRSSSFSAVTLTSAGEVLATFRLGSDREGPDGHPVLMVTDDGGDTWRMRFLGLGERTWDGVRGEARVWMIAELTPGELTASALWVDRSDPDAQWVNPQTQGVLPMRTYLLTSRDGGATWGDRRRVDLAPHPGASPTGPILRLAGGVLAQPFEHWKEYRDPSPAWPRAMLRLSHDGGVTWPDDAVVAAHPANERYYWDQRLEVDPETGELIGMFWTHDPATGRDVDVHVAWGSADGRTWTAPEPTGLPGQHCTPIALGGDRVVAVYARRDRPGGIRAALSRDFGRTWDRDGEITLYESTAAAQAGEGMARSQDEYWNDMGAWTFGHPRGVVLPSGELLVVFYGGEGEARSARWARVAVDE